MNWVKENKFLFAFLMFMLVGIGALGFLLMSARSQYEEALTGYQETASELSRIQKSPIFPNQKNLDKLVAQKKQATAEATKLAQALASQQIPAEEMSPAAFQDKLKAAVSALKAKAAQASPPVKLPTEGFFLGFNKYETAPPDAEAAVQLGRQLKVLDWVLGKLIESRVAEIKSLERPELPEEKGKAKVEEKKGAPSKSEKKVAVRKNPFEVVFVADQANFKQVLNALVDYRGQFIIPRAIVVKNEKDKGPARVAAGIAGLDPAGAAAPPAATNPDGTAAAAPAPAAGTAPVAASATYIVGEEKIEVRLFLEAVDFLEVAAK